MIVKHALGVGPSNLAAQPFDLMWHCDAMPSSLLINPHIQNVVVNAACVHVTWPCWHGHVGVMLESTHRPNVRVDAAHSLNTSYLFQVLVCSLNTHMLPISWFDLNLLGKQLCNGVCYTKQLVDCPKHRFN